MNARVATIITILHIFLVIFNLYLSANTYIKCAINNTGIDDLLIVIANKLDEISTEDLNTFLTLSY